MDFNEYQKKSRKSFIYPKPGKNLIFPVLGLCGESGEVAEKVKKLIRDKGSRIDNSTKEGLKEELGDVIWYVSQIASELEIPLEEIINKNIQKISDRKKRKVLHGSGDRR
ncbi:MAG: nucleoside triphosphate pyrophosphohydrolase family protein [Patescibacteria group bacterium]